MRYAQVIGFGAIVAAIGAFRTGSGTAAALAFLLFLVFIGSVNLLGRLGAKIGRKPRRQLTRLS